MVDRKHDVYNFNFLKIILICVWPGKCKFWYSPCTLEKYLNFAVVGYTVLNILRLLIHVALILYIPNHFCLFVLLAPEKGFLKSLTIIVNLFVAI